MMTAQRNRLWWAAGLVISGLLLLIWNFELLTPYEPWTQVLLAIMLLAVSVGFFSGYLGGQQWWRYIPAWIMAALTAMALLDIWPAAAAEAIAALLFVGMAAAFIHIYLLQRQEHWWALLPAGFTLVIALLVAVSALTQRITILGALLFGGMGAVFFVLYALSHSTQRWWALIPGGVLTLFSLVILTTQPEDERSYLRWWPVLLVAAGLVVLWFTDSRTGSTAHYKPSAVQLPPRAESGRGGGDTQAMPGTSVNLLPERDKG
jgi:hypothetical protein